MQILHCFRSINVISGVATDFSTTTTCAITVRCCVRAIRPEISRTLNVMNFKAMFIVTNCLIICMDSCISNERMDKEFLAAMLCGEWPFIPAVCCIGAAIAIKFGNAASGICSICELLCRRVVLCIDMAHTNSLVLQAFILVMFGAKRQLCAIEHQFYHND